MTYGASAKQVPAKGLRSMSDVDIFKIAMLAKTERGIAITHRDIYGMNDFEKVAGSYMAAYYGAYEADRFYNTLKPGINVQMILRSFIATDAVQATGTLNDSNGTPVKAYDIKAGYKNNIDKSAFGNKIAYKIAKQLNYKNKLTADSSASGSTTISLDSVEGYKVGYIGKIVDGGSNAKTAYFIVTAVDTVLKTLTFITLGNATKYDAATTTVYRVDIKLEIAIKDQNGQYQKKETWEAPFISANTSGLVYMVNHPVTGSVYVILTYNTATTSTLAADLVPADVTTWTCLTSGADGTAPIDSDWNTLAASIQDEDFLILLAPESASATHNNNMTTFCSADALGMYLGQCSNGASEDALRTFGLQLRSTYQFGMIPTDKWMEIDAPLVPGSKKQVPASAYAAAHYFNMYTKYGVGRVAAGNVDPLNTTDTLLDSNGIVHDDKNGVGDRLIRNCSINIARYRLGKGITLNSARTLSTDDGYKFQNQIMTFLLLKKSILTYLRLIEQDPAGYDAQVNHKNAIWAYLKTKYDAGVFFKGQKADGSNTKMEDVVQVVNDFSVNTLADIANGKETNFVQVICAPPIEEPVLDLASAPVTYISSK